MASAQSSTLYEAIHFNAEEDGFSLFLQILSNFMIFGVGVLFVTSIIGIVVNCHGLCNEKPLLKNNYLDVTDTSKNKVDTI